VTGRHPVTYRAAGVDIAAGDRAVELIRDAVLGTHRPGVRGELGGFAGLFELDLARYRHPLLATSTDGVGTKLAIAQALGRHDTVGIDLVAMVADDIAVCGAEPLFMTDYIACGRLEPQRVAAIVSGVAEGCRTAGCALVGGETAEHPGLLAPDAYDLAGAGVGVVERDRLLGPHLVQAGDVLVALASSGLHSNGYSLARHALLDRAGLRLDDRPDELGGRPLGEVLLTPSLIYARHCLALTEAVPVHAFAHITGGGLAANLQRVLPANVGAVVDRTSWPLPAVFRLVAERGPVQSAELERTFNVGVGMLAVLPGEHAEAALQVLRVRGVNAWCAGEVVTGDGRVQMVGRHPG
jgi:phosphoribosylformylglycinamidine cyclo-ligase